MASRRASLDAIEALMRLSATVESRRRQLARGAGLTDAQWRVLEEIGQDDFLPSLFARGRRLQPAAVSRTLRELLDRNWIRAVVAVGDRRKREYHLTARGRRVLARLASARERALVAVWDAQPPAELEAFSRFAADLAERLEAHHGEVDAAG